MVWTVMIVPMVLALGAVLLTWRDEEPARPSAPPCPPPGCPGPARARRAAPRMRERRTSHASH